MRPEPGDNRQSSPQDLAEWLPLGAVAISGGKLLLDQRAAKRLVVDPKKPLTAAVLASRAGTAASQLIVAIDNPGAHGAYVTAVVVEEPKGVAVRVHRHRSAEDPWQPFSTKGTFGLSSGNDENDEEPDLPAFLPAGQQIALRLELDGLTRERLPRQPFGKLRLSYVVAGVANELPAMTVEYAFAVAPIPSP